MSQATRQSPPGDPPAPWLTWIIGVPFFYAFLTLCAVLIGIAGVAGSRALQKPQTARLTQLVTTEARLLAGISTTHPSRWLASWVDRIRPALPRQINTDINALPFPVAKPYLNDALLVGQLCLRRGLIAFGLLAPLGLVLLVAVQDGLTERELRRFGGDPESAFLYRHAKSSVATSVGLGLAVYLLLPIAVHPHFVLTLLAPLFGLAVFFTVSKFKKYL